jgi:hypothetical protein
MSAGVQISLSFKKTCGVPFASHSLYFTFSYVSTKGRVGDRHQEAPVDERARQEIRSYWGRLYICFIRAKFVVRRQKQLVPVRNAETKTAETYARFRLWGCPNTVRNVVIRSGEGYFCGARRMTYRPPSKARHGWWRKRNLSSFYRRLQTSRTFLENLRFSTDLGFIKGLMWKLPTVQRLRFCRG